MENQNLLVQLGQKRNYLRSLHELLKNSTQLKAKILFTGNNSEKKLIAALITEPKNPDEIAKLSKRLENDRCLYANCELDIIKYQADSIATKIEIKCLERRFEESINNNKTFFNFHKTEKDGHDNNKFQVLSSVCQYSQATRLRFIGS